MKNGRTPSVSVIMGVRYQKSDTALLERSVRSILAQSYTDFEFLICENGSTPEARHFLETAASGDGRVRLIDGQGMGSLARKLNRCLKEAKGNFIARMDDDDYSQPTRFEKQLAFLKAHPEFGFVGCNVRIIRGGEPAGRYIFPEEPEVRDFYMVQPYIHPALIFRREALNAVNGYSEDARCVLCEDYDLLLRLYAAGYKGANLRELLFDYTVPLTAKGNRKMRHRLNETVTRYRRFKQLGKLPAALPYVIKPLAVGLLPEGLLRKVKAKNF